jgi:hypothetical protein
MALIPLLSSPEFGKLENNGSMHVLGSERRGASPGEDWLHPRGVCEVHWWSPGGGEGVGGEGSARRRSSQARASGKEAGLGARASEAFWADPAAGWCLDLAAGAGPSTCFRPRHGAGGIGGSRGVWRVRVHRFWRVAHAARCAACDHSGARGAAAPVSNRARGGGGVSGAALLLELSASP